MSKFSEGVIQIVNMIPKGKVVSYGQIALYLGMPRAAREVGWVLNKLESGTQTPWWRVVNNKGYLSIKGSEYTAQDQRELLVREGIEVGEDFTFDIEKYRFVPNEKVIKKLQIDSSYLDMIGSKIPYSKSFHN